MGAFTNRRAPTSTAMPLRNVSLKEAATKCFNGSVLIFAEKIYAQYTCMCPITETEGQF